MFCENNYNFFFNEREGVIRKQCNQNRNFLLTKIDLINPIRWESFTEEQKNTLRNYRQDLLDVPQQKDFPNNIIWPILPKDLL